MELLQLVAQKLDRSIRRSEDKKHVGHRTGIDQATHPCKSYLLATSTIPNDAKEQGFRAIEALVEHHEVAEVLVDLIRKDGGGSWPPKANHNHATWPLPLQPYKNVYLGLAPLLSQATPSLDDQVDIVRIAESATGSAICFVSVLT
jgi:hypothetical protein